MLTDGIQGLQKLKKKGKGVNKTIIEEREKKVWRLAWQCGCSTHNVQLRTVQVACVAHGTLISLHVQDCPTLVVQLLESLSQPLGLCWCADCRCRSS